MEGTYHILVCKLAMANVGCKGLISYAGNGQWGLEGA